MQAQKPLVTLANRIRQVAVENGLGGFAGTQLKVAASEVTLYWHGQLPPAVTRVQREVPAGVTLRVENARYSLATLDAEARRLGSFYAGRVKINSIGPLPDYSGLRIQVDPSTGAGLARQRIRSQVNTVITEAPSAIPLAERWDDGQPYWGGSVITSLTNSCSTGYSVTRSGTEAMITSQHCGMNTDWFTPAGRPVGRTAVGSAAHDAALITGVLSQVLETYGPYIYIGDWHSTRGENVSGWHYVSVGEYVCMGGAFTGEICRNRVDFVNTYISNGTVGPGYWTTQLDGLGAAGQGDSGGPSYNRDTLGVHAAGIITAGGQAAACIGYQNRKCFKQIFSSNLGNVLSTLGAKLKTAS